MIYTEPILTLPVFVAMFMIIAGIAEYIVRKQNKGSHSSPTLYEHVKAYNSKYYNTKKKSKLKGIEKMLKVKMFKNNSGDFQKATIEIEDESLICVFVQGILIER